MADYTNTPLDELTAEQRRQQISDRIRRRIRQGRSNRPKREELINREERRERGMRRLRRWYQGLSTNQPPSTNTIPKKKNGYYPLHGED